MKLEELSEAVEGELLPRSRTPKADQIGRWLATEAIKRFGTLGTDGVTYHHTKEDPERRAKQMAGNFYQAMLDAIDDHFKMHKMKKVG